MSETQLAKELCTEQHYTEEDLLNFIADNHDAETVQHWLDAVCDCV